VEQCFFICNLKPVLFLPDDYIIREGERGDSLYFINKGECDVTLRDSKTKEQNCIAILKDGVIFGEIALLTKLKRTATVVSKDFSNCAYLGKE
jgi:CRP-like cAMP-binding protein